MHINVFERNFSGDVLGQHHHARHPEKDNVEASDQYRGGQIFLHEGVLLLERFSFFPIQSGERPQRRGEPCVEYIVISLEISGVAIFCSELFCFCFIMRDINFAAVGIPRWNLMSPPQLARDAPVLNVVQPLVVSVHPIFRMEFYFA